MILMLKNINIGEDMNENCSFLQETYILTRGSRKRAWLIVSEGIPENGDYRTQYSYKICIKNKMFIMQTSLNLR